MPQVLNRFNKISSLYDQLADFIFGKSIREAQTCHLDKIPPRAKVLVLGGGTGWWLRELLEKDSSLQIYFIEASDKMIARARKSIDEQSDVRFIHGTEEDVLKLNTDFDVIITFFYLDMFDEKELRRITPTLYDYLRTGGFWLVADFVKLSWWHGIMLFVMYSFFRFIGAIEEHKLADWKKIIGGHPLQMIRQESRYGGFIKSVIFKKEMTSNK